jgi:hypothetical protein
MMKQLAVFAAATILCQLPQPARTSTMVFGFQQTGWVGLPGAHATEFHPLKPDGQIGPRPGQAAVRC